MPTAALAALLRDLLIAVLGNSTLTQKILAAIGVPAQTDDVLALETAVAALHDDVVSPTSGLLYLADTLNTVLTDLTLGITVIEAKLDLITSGGAVVLPTIPPSGYGGLSMDDTFRAVWGGLHYGDLSTPYTYLKAGGLERYSLGDTTGYRPDGSIFAYYYTTLDSVGAHGTYYPTGDYGTILATDDLLTWLSRVNPAGAVFWWNGVGSFVGINGDNGDGTTQWITTIDNVGFEAIKASLFPTLAAVDASLWPGLAGVVLGAPVDLAVGVTLTTPMDGVLIEITSAPLKQGYFTFDTLRSYRNVGALAFTSDNGDAEFPQTLGFVSAVYVPKSMVTAAGVVIRCSVDVVGTVTPWSRITH